VTSPSRLARFFCNIDWRAFSEDACVSAYVCLCVHMYICVCVEVCCGICLCSLFCGYASVQTEGMLGSLRMPKVIHITTCGLVHLPCSVFQMLHSSYT